MIWLTLSLSLSDAEAAQSTQHLPISSYPPTTHFTPPPLFISSTIYTTLWKEEQQKEQKARWRWRPQNQKGSQSIQGSQAAPSQPYTLKPPSKKHSQLAIVAGREGGIPSKAPQLIELNISFQIFTFFTSFLGAFQFLLFFFFFFFSNFLSSSSLLAPPSAMATHKLLSYISSLLSSLSSYSTLGCPIWIWMEMILLDFHIFIMLPGICARSRSRSRSKLLCCCCSCYPCFCCLPYRDPQRFAFSATAWQVHLSLLNCFKIP